MSVSPFNDVVDARGDDGNRDETDARGQPSLPKMSQSIFSSLRYDIRRQNRGVAVIISNTNFDPNTGIQKPGRNNQSGVLERGEKSADAKIMHDLLQTLGFKNIQSYDNKTVADMRGILQAVADKDHTNNDCFVCVILTHGDDGLVFGTDGNISVDDLVEPFKGHKCTSLAGKPKLFFIQSSKGYMPDDVESHETDTGDESLPETIRLIPREADFLMAYSMIPAWSNSSRSSWFIQAISDVFSQNWETMDLLTMMTRVNKKVALSFESKAGREFERHKRQIPYITSMLTKQVFLTN